VADATIGTCDGFWWSPGPSGPPPAFFSGCSACSWCRRASRPPACRRCPVPRSSAPSRPPVPCPPPPGRPSPTTPPPIRRSPRRPPQSTPLRPGPRPGRRRIRPRRPR